MNAFPYISKVEGRQITATSYSITYHLSMNGDTTHWGHFRSAVCLGGHLYDVGVVVQEMDSFITNLIDTEYVFQVTMANLSPSTYYFSDVSFATSQQNIQFIYADSFTTPLSTGIAEASAPALTIQSLGSSKTILIQNAANDIGQPVRVFDILGDKCFESRIESNQVEISLVGKPAGFYLVNIGSTRPVTRRIFLE